MNLDKLNGEFSIKSYLYGYSISEHDFALFKSLRSADLSKHPHLNRWYRHIKSYEGVKEDSSEMTEEADLPLTMLQELDKEKVLDTLKLAAEWNIPHQKVIGAVHSLLAHDGIVKTIDKQVKNFDLTNEGQTMVENGSYEYNLFQAVGPDGATEQDLSKHGFFKFGKSNAMANGWITIDKDTNPPRFIRKVETVVDGIRNELRTISKGGHAVLSENSIKQLKKRKLIVESVTNALIVTKGPSFTLTLEKSELELTADLISSGEWRTKTFKQYNFNAQGVQPSSGCLHPLLKVRAEFREIFFQMGFSEMPTNRYVESSFWNFDALFQPQQHPARDAHDTFFISDPELSTDFPMDYLEKVQNVHSRGGFGSIGYGYDWKIEEAQKNVLRTHTTAVSARQLYLLAQNGFRPAKMFSIDRVFRNETLDATHLAEFHQVEGVIAERNLSLAHVIGLFTEFFRKCGIENLRFKHTYNPYTEPSMEIYAFHKHLNKWVEIGNSGLFRPEMLLPMGLPEDVNVAGFGLSLERPTMIRYDIQDIRKLFGHRIDLSKYRNAIIRLEKHD